MKRLFIISMAVILVAAMSVTGIIAVSANEPDSKVQKVFYVDADNDGVCDNKSENCEDTGNGAGYVDADNDGVCDNKGENRSGEGKGMGCGKGFGRCRNFR